MYKLIAISDIELHFIKTAVAPYSTVYFSEYFHTTENSIIALEEHYCDFILSVRKIK